MCTNVEVTHIHSEVSVISSAVHMQEFMALSKWSFETETCKWQESGSPNCWIARSALHGNSNVMWTLRRWLRARLSLCREIPLEAASEMIATSFSPSMNLCFSAHIISCTEHINSRNHITLTDIWPITRISLKL
jgi:hypothetical protein